MRDYSRYLISVESYVFALLWLAFSIYHKVFKVHHVGACVSLISFVFPSPNLISLQWSPPLLPLLCFPAVPLHMFFILSYLRNSNMPFKIWDQTSLVVQWLSIRLPMQEMSVRSLGWEDPTCQGVTKPMCHNFWAHTLEAKLHNKRSHCNEKPMHCN